MIKKLLLLSAFAFSCLSMQSCSTNNSKILNLKAEGIDSYVQLTGDDLSYHLASRDDLVLMVSLPGCHGCNVSKTFIKEYVKNTNNIFYVIEYHAYSDIQPNQKELPKVTKTPTFLYFKSGNLLKMIEGATSDYDSFAAQMAKYVQDINLYSLNTFTKMNEDTSDPYYIEDKSDTSVLDKKLSETPDLTVFFTWLRCGDCQNFHQKTFDSYVVALDKSIKVYQFEVDYFRRSKPGVNPGEGNDGYEDYMLWLNFATKYGFNTYRDGKVPVIINYQNGNFSSMAVFANDTGITTDENNQYYYGTTFFPEIKDIRGKTEADLISKVEKRELELMTEYMNTHIKGEKVSS